MLDLRTVRVTGPSATPVDLRLEAGVTLVVGVSGSGATSLLDAIAGRTERPVRGRVALDGRSLTGASETELDGVVSHVGRRPRRAGTVGSMATGTDRHWIDDLDLGAHLATNRTMLEPDAAARAALLEACIDEAPVVVIDQVLAPMCAGSRRRAADVVRQLGDRGRIVVWAEHDLTTAVPVSDRIVDLSAGTTVSAPDTWTSPVLPPTPLARLADRLGVERSRTSTVSRSRELLTDLGVTCHLRPRRRKDPGEDLLTVEAPRVGLTGAGTITVRSMEVLGIVSSAHATAERVARALYRTGCPLPDDRDLAHLLGVCALPGVCTRIDRASRQPRGTTRRFLDEHRLAATEQLPAAAPLRPMSAGQSRAVVDLLSLATCVDAGDHAAPGLLVNPTDGLDARSCADLASLMGGAGGLVVVDRDIEFLTTVCDRLLLVEDEQLVLDAAPSASLDELPWLPVVAEVCRPLRVTDLDEVDLVPATGEWR